MGKKIGLMGAGHIGNSAMAKLVMMGLVAGVDVMGEFDKISAKNNKQPRELTRFDHERIEKARLTRERRNAKRLKHCSAYA